MKLYYFVTPHYQTIVDRYFLPFMPSDFDLREARLDQQVERYVFQGENWADLCLYKADVIVQAVRENMGSNILFTDADIQFFRPCRWQLEQLLEEHSMAFQNNLAPGEPGFEINFGFFAVWCDAATLAFWEAFRTLLRSNTKIFDQELVTLMLRQVPLKWAMLSHEEFMCPGRKWEPGQPLPVTPNLAMHHANWTMGIESKLRQLEQARAQFVRLDSLLNEARVDRTLFNGSALPYDGCGSRINSCRGLYELIKENLTPGSTVIETGTHRGISTELFALYTKQVLTVDTDICFEARDRLSKYSHVTCLQAESIQLASQLPDQVCDAVYLDTAHTYEHVKAEILAWLPKIVPGGFICGHDYTLHDPGLMKAVNELLGQPDKVYSDGSWIFKLPDASNTQTHSRTDGVSYVKERATELVI
ncbi:MAG: class I SAM-dependent methyltransferase [Deltaproteobacteria bacterium]|nr:class I SAM-dependent methyltransferase [Deltaproteobacteria bacterium]